MVLVLLGTQDKSFKRMLKEVVNQIDKGNIKDKVIVQAGHTKYISNKMKIFDFVKEEDIKRYIKNANYIITHGGVGSIMDGIKNNKKIIAVPRLKKYYEHTNDHQLEIVREFDKEGYIIGLNDVNELEKGLKRVITFKSKNFKSNTNNMIKILEEYISN